MVEVFSLGSAVFEDTNNNGLQDIGETGISGVTVQLFDATGTTEILVGADGVLGTADDAAGGVITDTNGNYYFNGLDEESYTIVIPESNFDPGQALEDFPLSSNFTTISDNQEDGDDNGIQSGGIGTRVISPAIQLQSGTEPTGSTENGLGGDTDDSGDANGDMTVDFGFVPKNIVNGTGGSEVINTSTTGGTTAGNDFVTAGAGQDTLTGGEGDDCYHFNITSDGIDVITDFGDNGNDKLDFSNIFNDELSSLNIPANSNPYDTGYVEAIVFGTGVMIQVDSDPNDSGDDPLNKSVVLLRNTSVSDIDATDFIF